MYEKRNQSPIKPRHFAVRLVLHGLAATLRDGAESASSVVCRRGLHKVHWDYAEGK
jgi:hypothetical protein